MDKLQRTLSSPSFRRQIASQFGDQCVVDENHLRPLYPEETFSILARLVDPKCRRALDVGCGTGEIARRIAPYVEHVDAVDLAPAMIAKGKSRTGGDAPNLTWIQDEIESAPLTPPYGLITAAACLHWMEPISLGPFMPAPAFQGYEWAQKPATLSIQPRRRSCGISAQRALFP